MGNRAGRCSLIVRPCDVLEAELNDEIQRHADAVDNQSTKNCVIEKGELLKYFKENTKMCKQVGIDTIADAEHVFNSADLDLDGLVSTDEYVAHMRAWNMFRLADTNANGTLSVTELARFLKQHKIVVERVNGRRRSDRDVFKDFVSTIDACDVDKKDFFTRDEFCRTVALWMYPNIIEARAQEAAKILKKLKQSISRLDNEGTDFASKGAKLIGERLQEALLHQGSIQGQRPRLTAVCAARAKKSPHSMLYFGLNLRLASERFAKMVLEHRGVDSERLKSSHAPCLFELIGACAKKATDREFIKLFGKGKFSAPLFGMRSKHFRNLNWMLVMTNPCLQDCIADDCTARISFSPAEQAWLLRYADWLAEETWQLLQTAARHACRPRLAPIEDAASEFEHDDSDERVVKRQRRE